MRRLLSRVTLRRPGNLLDLADVTFRIRNLKKEPVEPCDEYSSK